MEPNGKVAHFLPILAATWAFNSAAAAHAAEASPWHDDIQSSARLIAAQARVEGSGRVFRGGIEIRLKPGWKTYWRYPGDSGVPPVFDFAGSDNVRTVTVLYPAPIQFPDGAGGNSIGYKDGVVLPLHISPYDPTKPVKLRLKLDYAACEKLCVPAHADLVLMLSGQATSYEPQISAAELRVPRPATIAGAGSLSIRSVQREERAGKPRVVVEVAAPAQASVTLFAEGPTPDWALPLPRPLAGVPAGLHRFAFELDGLPSGTRAAGALLRLTAVAGGEAIEVPFRLD